MAAMTDSVRQQQSRRSAWLQYDYALFFREHVTSSWLQMLWIFIITLLTASFVVSQLNVAPATTTIVLALWVLGLGMSIAGEIQRRHSAVSRWMREGLFSSITNAFLTLVLVLGILAAIRGFWDYAVVRATFDPAVTAPEFRTPETGASWGVLVGAWKLLTTGTLDVELLPRVYLALWFVIGMSLASLVVYNERLRDRLEIVRRIFTVLWLLSPLILFVFLAGVEPAEEFPLQTLITGEIVVLAIYALLYWQRVVRFRWQSFAVWLLVWPALFFGWQTIAASGTFPVINVDNWGGFLFTMIISVFAIIASFPLGVALALGRRSTVRGIPAWLTWPIAIAVTAWGFIVTTPQLIEDARNSVELLIAFWPVLIIIAAYVFQRLFVGNVVAAASTVFIEVVRGVPLITVLFTAIVLAPLFFPAGAQVKNAWAVLIAFTLFTAAYLAENVRGGLQSISKGQYEAADAIGLNTLQKMRFIILPQALRAVIPAIVGLFIGIFKDSSLVAVVGLFDLLGIVNPIISNPNWLGLRRELYLFAAVVYFIGSYAMSSYSRRLETRLGVGER